MRHRLLVAAIGAFFILVGLNRLASGVFVAVNHLHQPVYATDAIGLGAVIALFALIPSSWLERSARLRKPQPGGRKRTRS
jgi:hypothetical protein